MPDEVSAARSFRISTKSAMSSPDEKDDPADVAKVGFQAMLDGDGDVVAGWKNKLQSAVANVVPAGALAQQHRKMAEPGSADR
jgi:hypothetical protein